MRSVLLFLFMATAAHAAEWRTFAGGFSTRWKTVGVHGHNQPLCAQISYTWFEHSVLVKYPNCNPIDFARGNLDNSIGFRAGRERDFLTLGPLHLVGGTEGSMSYTEYNLSQADFALVTAAVTAGVDLHLWSARIGARYGAGPFVTTDAQEVGINGFKELSLTVPLRPGAGLRLSTRDVEALKRWSEVKSPADNPRSPAAREFALMFVASPEYSGMSRWEFATATGNTATGQGMGSDRSLRDTAFTRFSASRDLSWHDLQLEVAWSSTAHESERPTMFLGYNGNFRSKTIDGIGVGVARTRTLFDRLSVRYGGGIEVADWRDEHQLLTRDGNELVAGVETALTTSVALRYKIAPHLAVESGFQKVYWQGIDLGEGRWALGIVLTR